METWRANSPARRRSAIARLAFFVVLATPFAEAQPSQLLWQIGEPDRNDAEFALAPDHFQQFEQDGFFVIGESDPRRDWPYAHPGPGDAWGGRREHTFAILFGLQRPPSPGDCRLQLNLVDTHSTSPPKVHVVVNGQAFERALVPGAGDASIQGSAAKGKPQTVTIAFPAALLRVGDNAINITIRSGSWLLYDWIGLETPGAELTKVQARTVVERTQAIPAVVEAKGKLLQPVRVSLRHFGDDAEGAVRLENGETMPIHVKRGDQVIEVLAPAISATTRRQLMVQIAGQDLPSREVVLQPVRRLMIYVLPHSHTDIGYTEIQTAIEKKQVNNLLQGMEGARKTASYPEGARFVWNVEVLWAADLYLNRLDETQRARFFEAVKSGQVALNGMYLNELTGLCREEELLRLFRYSTELAARCDTVIDSAMISDVPGYTWGTVTAMAQAGIKYFSVAPNYFDRIGDILVQWENKPFYWVSPSGNEKVLVWIPFKGYAMSHMYPRLTPEFVAEYLGQLDKMSYPYDITYMRWSGHGDNAAPDPEICEFIKDWNTRYAYPKFMITSTSAAFRAFEVRYGNKLPRVRGDWTPYWEDGAGSSAYETAMNRASSARLAQAETLWAMLDPRGYPATAFEEAWRNVLLYSEHTWGASVSVSDPENQATKEQWEIKRSYALQAERQSRQLLKAALAQPSTAGSEMDVFNTCSWPRTELVVLSPEDGCAGDRVLDSSGRPVPSQRLTSGALAFVARDVPPFGARRYSITGGDAWAKEKATAQGTVLDNGLVQVRIDEKTGGIVELRAKAVNGNLVDTASGHALNDYVFLPGDNLADLKGNGLVKISVRENGPLVASLLIDSDAPGCKRLTREVRLIAGFDHVELINTVDKERAAVSPKPGDWQFAQKGGKESVNFAFPFKVPQGVVHLDIPFGLVRPEVDQIPGSCKNWFTVNRSVDVDNRDYGITWVTLDAPLLQVGGITANLLGSQNNPSVWRNKVERTQTVYSWVMNNHWGTNYRAYQEGPVVFRYVIRPHRRSAPDENTRFTTGFSEPLIAARAGGRAFDSQLLRVEPEGVLVTAMKPSDDGKAVIIRLFGASGHDANARFSWAHPPEGIYLSDTSEHPLQKLKGRIPVPGWGLVTLRVEFSSGTAARAR